MHQPPVYQFLNDYPTLGGIPGKILFSVISGKDGEKMSRDNFRGKVERLKVAEKSLGDLKNKGSRRCLTEIRNQGFAICVGDWVDVSIIFSNFNSVYAIRLSKLSQFVIESVI